MSKLEQILSCDWGTTSFRIRLVDVATASIITETKSERGIAAVYEEWLQHKLSETARISFYLQTIKDAIRTWNVDLNKVPTIISGMASSTIGMCELPYAKLPFTLHAAQLQYRYFNEDNARLLVVSGLSSDNDVMRGEETMLLGCTFPDAGCVAVLPGTHSKHAFIENSSVHEIKTYMTGEFFQLLASKSILANSVSKPADNLFDKTAFIAGVLEAAHGNILNTAFHVRTNSLLNNTSATSNYYFLSGLIIGTELKDLDAAKEVYLITNNALQPLYSVALNTLHASLKVNYVDADKAVIKGHLKIAKQLIDII